MSEDTDGIRSVPSLAARGLAERMRAFDPALSDEELATIAEHIDLNRDAFSKALHPEGTPLKNGDEPIPQFSVDEHTAG